MGQVVSKISITRLQSASTGVDGGTSPRRTVPSAVSGYGLSRCEADGPAPVWLYVLYVQPPACVVKSLQFESNVEPH